MAPRPYENNFRVRLAKTGNGPAIYAISSGPQKGVHMLSTEPLPPALQYMYRHPINIHSTFLDVTGDFLRRRFDSIEAAQRWIDEMDRSPSLLADQLAASLSLSMKPSLAATSRERRRDPVYKGPGGGVVGMGGGAGGMGVGKGPGGMGGGLGAAGMGKVSAFRVAKKVEGRYSRSHTGAMVRRRSDGDVAGVVGLERGMAEVAMED
ncbi:uncharacterized protein H6S33_011115 [Morchella sextelata]|uniref:uncharacterized protein n=1 Tax=Morchella sextelata TaxID=1174677 RepID=UPI001D0450C6|nr:uncharacterized protein H6S33_011115 [Morchella sextelata]KAH0611850.1 hypothetical protein H6S33_011115 [Morchella sextelata]